MFVEGHASPFLSTMPPERSKKLRERINLARSIELSGIEMSPCSFCERNNHKCIVAERLNRYSEYARRGQRCDVKGIPTSSWLALEREEKRLNTEEAKATAAAAEAMARLQRLQKQKKFLRTRARDMLRRSLKTLDKLDKAEDREKREQEALAAVATPVVLERVDLDSILGLSEFDPNPSFWSSV